MLTLQDLSIQIRERIPTKIMQFLPKTKAIGSPFLQKNAHFSRSFNLNLKKYKMSLKNYAIFVKNKGYRLISFAKNAHFARSYSSNWKKDSFKSHAIFAKNKALGLLFCKKCLLFKIFESKS